MFVLIQFSVSIIFIVYITILIIINIIITLDALDIMVASWPGTLGVWCRAEKQTLSWCDWTLTSRRWDCRRH